MHYVLLLIVDEPTARSVECDLFQFSAGKIHRGDNRTRVRIDDRQVAGCAAVDDKQPIAGSVILHGIRLNSGVLDGPCHVQGHGIKHRDGAIEAIGREGLQRRFHDLDAVHAAQALELPEASP